MQWPWYLLYHSKTNTFWMCDTDLARIGDLRCRQCNAITEDNCLLFFAPCASQRQHHPDYSLRNHKKRCECLNVNCASPDLVSTPLPFGRPVVWRAGCGSERSRFCQILQPLTSCCGSSLR